MNSIVLTDSTSDLEAGQADAIGLRVIPLTVHFDGRDWLDHQELGSEELFRRVDAGAAMPVTAPPTVQAYRETLEALLQRHDHVLAVHVSSRLSDTCSHAAEAALAFPGRVTVHDSWQSAAGLALQAERAARLMRDHVPAAQVAQVLQSLRQYAQTRMCLNTLGYLQRGGRIGGAAALLGGLLNLKPILGLREGRVEPFARAVGAGRAMNSMTEQLRACAASLPQGRVAFFHNGASDSVDALRFEARRLGVQESMTLSLGTVLSAHSGPGVFGFSFEPAHVWQNFRSY
ncbi:DegV family protein [Deinococcus depolymerans]